uniref:Uncharacterized protein n=1 Tax=Arundo donax TaxID=35708 RepID=A0A0A9ASP5_ARUDO
MWSALANRISHVILLRAVLGFAVVTAGRRNMSCNDRNNLILEF